jgi:hypothetical protein
MFQLGRKDVCQKVSPRVCVNIVAILIILLGSFNTRAFAAPDAPTNITLSNMKTHGPTVSWTTMPNATNYNIYRSSDNATWTQIGSVAHPTSDLTDSTAPRSNTVYYWTVTAVDGTGESAKPAGISGRTALMPGWNLIAAPDYGLTTTALYGPWADWVWSWMSNSNVDADNSGTWQPLTQITSPGTSQFVWANDSGTILTAPTSLPPRTVINATLVPGWNLISSSPLSVYLSNIGANWKVDGSTPLSTAISNNIIDDRIYEWNGKTNDSWSITNDKPIIVPLHGYMLLNRDSVNHTLVIGTPGIVEITTNPSAPYTNQTSLYAAFYVTFDTATVSVDGGPEQPAQLDGSGNGSIQLSGLADGAHSIKVTGTDLEGGDHDYAIYSWTVDTVRPTIVSISHGPTSMTITINWTTDEPATTKLNWGLGADTSTVVPDDGVYSTAHQVRLTGLTTNTTYSYIAGGQDRAGNSYNSSRRQVRTNY